jgi:hypothetical protein
MPGLGPPVEYGTPTPSVTQLPVVLFLSSCSERIPAASTVWRMKYQAWELVHEVGDVEVLARRKPPRTARG